MNKTSRSFRIIIIEFILMLGVFTVMSVIIVKMFLSADHMSREALDYSKAVIKSESIAERLKGSTSFEAVLTDLGMIKAVDGDKTFYYGYYGRDWERSQETGMYEITVYLENIAGSNGHMEKAEIITARVKERTGSQDELNDLCRLNVSKYIHD
jgi:hypothetical protein